MDASSAVNVDIYIYSRVLQYGGGVREQYDRLIGGSSPYFFRVLSPISQSCRATVTALHRDTALLSPPYWGPPTAFVKLVSGMLLLLLLQAREQHVVAVASSS